MAGATVGPLRREITELKGLVERVHWLPKSTGTTTLASGQESRKEIWLPPQQQVPSLVLGTEEGGEKIERELVRYGITHVLTEEGGAPL